MLAIAAVLFTSCGKDEESTDTRPDCEKNSTGTIRVKNYKSNPYNVYIDDSFKATLQANGYNDFTVSAGAHYLEFIQESGYLFNPDVYTSNLTVSACNEREILIQ